MRVTHNSIASERAGEPPGQHQPPRRDAAAVVQRQADQQAVGLAGGTVSAMELRSAGRGEQAVRPQRRRRPGLAQHGRQRAAGRPARLVTRARGLVLQGMSAGDGPGGPRRARRRDPRDQRVRSAPSPTPRYLDRPVFGGTNEPATERLPGRPVDAFNGNGARTWCARSARTPRWPVNVDGERRVRRRHRLDLRDARRRSLTKLRERPAPG